MGDLTLYFAASCILLLRILCLKASGDEMSGFGAPFRTATTMPERASTLTLPETTCRLSRTLPFLAEQ